MNPVPRYQASVRSVLILVATISYHYVTWEGRIDQMAANAACTVEKV